MLKVSRSNLVVDDQGIPTTIAPNGIDPPRFVGEERGKREGRDRCDSAAGLAPAGRQRSTKREDEP